MSDGAKCDFCDQPATRVAGETNGILACDVHGEDAPMTARVTHAPVGDLCVDDHMCPGCESGGECRDLFMHPTCGLVGCTAKEGDS